jgi:putative inorganic carbon (hco3(-)) transporter
MYDHPLANPKIQTTLILLAGLLMVFLFTWLQVSWTMTIALTLGMSLLGILAWRFEWGFVVLLVTRPLLDIFSKNTQFVLGPFTLNLPGLIGLLTAVAAILFLWRQRIVLFGLPLKINFLIFLGLSIFSLVYTVVPDHTFSVIIKFFNISAIFAVSYVLGKQTGNKKLFYYFILMAAVIPQLVGLWQLITGTGFSADGLFNRINGTLVHPNMFSFLLVLEINIYLLLLTIDKQKKYLWLAGLGMAMLLLVFTYTRSAWGGIFLTFLIWGFLRYKKWLTVGLLIAALSLLVWPMTHRFLSSNYDINLSHTQLYQRIVSDPSDDSSFNSRLELWTSISRKIIDKPLLGYGAGSFLAVRTEQIISAHVPPLLQAHNDYLRLAVELGLLGSLTYVSIWLGLLVLGIKAMWHMTDLSQQAYSILIVSLVPSFMLISFFDNLLRSTAIMWLLMASLGFALAALHPKHA